MSIAAAGAKNISDLLPDVRAGSLCFFGEWFGGRPDNWHTITQAIAEGDALFILFNEGETLTIVRPKRVTVSSDDFQIDEAARVRWEWFYYGRPRRRENLYVIEYVRTGSGGIEVTDTADWHEPEHHPDPTALAVVLG